MAIEIIPTGAAAGAEIRGVDLSQPMDDATFAAIDAAYNQHGVIFFRGQRITPPQQVAFSRRFGQYLLGSGIELDDKLIEHERLSHFVWLWRRV